LFKAFRDRAETYQGYSVIGPELDAKRI